jgi:predicted nucleotidyltransferase
MNAAVAEDTIDRAGRALIDAASTPAKVILFGSRARGDANDRSDFDFLVVERDVADRFTLGTGPWTAIDSGRRSGRQRAVRR